MSKRAFIYFTSEAEAQQALKESGFSLGRLQAGSPRGVLHGDFDIAKWRNLRNSDRDALHGVYQRQYREGPVEIVLSADCPNGPKNKLISLGLPELPSEAPS